MNNNRVHFLTGRNSLPVTVKFRLSMLKYLLNRRKYALFTLNRSKGGVLASNRILKNLMMCKKVRFNGDHFFSLTVPHWPSSAFDHMVANGGLNIAAAGTSLKKQVDIVIIGITGRCDYRCAHCYEHFSLDGQDKVPLETLLKIIYQIQQQGVSIITFSGGEPMLRFDDLISLVEAGDKSKSDFHIHTSGYQVTPERAVKLKKAGLKAAGIGLDDVNPFRNDAFRGYQGAFHQAVQAINCFREAGIFPYVNTCLTKELIRSGELAAFFELLGKLGVGIIRLLEPKPCGAYLEKDPQELFTDEDRRVVYDIYSKANTGKDFRDYPLISWEAFSESPENMGCMMAGHSHLYIDSSGNVQPCVFLPVSFGNILNEDFSLILDRMRKNVPKPLKIQCPSVQLNETICQKIKNGSRSPVTFEEIKKEFQELSEKTPARFMD